METPTEDTLAIWMDGDGWRWIILRMPVGSTRDWEMIAQGWFASRGRRPKAPLEANVPHLVNHVRCYAAAGQEHRLLWARHPMAPADE